MFRLRLKTAIIVIVCTLASTFVGCGGPGSFVQSFSLTPGINVLTPGSSVQFHVDTNHSVDWFVNGIRGGNATVGLIDTSGKYTVSPNGAAGQVIISARAGSNSAEAVVYIVEHAQVSPTANAQVAEISINVPVGSMAFVRFGPDTTYALKTSSQTATTITTIKILVAGMRAFTPYHMQAVVTLPSGGQFADNDLVFTTGGLSATELPSVNVQTFGVPQPGIELIDNIVPTAVPVYATDLNGNVIWYYRVPDGNIFFDFVNPVQMMPNGHLLLSIGRNASGPPAPPETINVLREIDLAGNTIRQLSLDELNQKLAKFSPTPITAVTIHHEVLPMANGHWITLISSLKHFDNVTGVGAADVLGDTIVELDENLNLVWTWSTFDHLDVNRHPFGFPDWTHSNALVYQPSDHSLVLSMRHQSWIIKIDYNDGHGTGNILWRLGKDGDFALQNGTDPDDWFYEQHGPQIFLDNGNGQYSMSVMDNGNARSFASGSCAASGNVPCPYSTVGVYQIDEAAHTATLTTHYRPGLFSFFGGYTMPLANGNIEADFCAAATPNGALIQEITAGPSPQVVWEMKLNNQFAYRGFRLPSLYPGVQW